MTDRPATRAEQLQAAREAAATMGGVAWEDAAGIHVTLPLPANATDEALAEFVAEAEALGFGVDLHQ